MVTAIESNLNTGLSRFAVRLQSAKHFYQMMIKAIKKDLLNEIFDNEKSKANALRRYESALSAVSEKSLVKMPLNVVTNSSMSAVKLMTISSGDHHDPLQQKSDESKRLQQMTQDIDTMSRLFDLYQDPTNLALTERPSDNLRAYMMTLTHPNTNKGQLSKAVTKLIKGVSSLNESLAAGNADSSRRDGLPLYDIDENQLQYVAGFAGTEITVNEECMEKHSSRGLFHDHAHFVIIVDGELNLKRAYDDLFAKWQSIYSSENLNKQAFKLEAAYSKEADRDGKLSHDEVHSSKDDLQSAAVEAIKYEIKPDSWNRFDVNDSSKFSVETFAELYAAVRGRRMKRTYGLLREAHSFNNKFSKILGATKFTAASQMPTIYTKMRRIGFDKSTRRYGWHDSRDLTNGEIGYYNRTLLKGCLADIADIIANYKLENDTKKNRVWLGVLKTYKFAKTFEELNVLFDEFKKSYHDNLHRINILQTAFRTPLIQQGFLEHGKDTFVDNDAPHASDWNLLLKKKFNYECKLHDLEKFQSVLGSQCFDYTDLSKVEQRIQVKRLVINMPELCTNDTSWAMKDSSFDRELTLRAQAANIISFKQKLRWVSKEAHEYSIDLFTSKGNRLRTILTNTEIENLVETNFNSDSKFGKVDARLNSEDAIEELNSAFKKSK